MRKTLFILILLTTTILFANFTEETKAGKVIVTDTKTNLQWTKDYGTSLTWQQALSYCENLDYGGYTDWRLPNIKELETLVDDTKYNPASSFPEMPSSWFWSSSSFVSPTYDAWYVYFGYGYVNYNNKAHHYSNARCVRCQL